MASIEQHSDVSKILRFPDLLPVDVHHNIHNMVKEYNGWKLGWKDNMSIQTSQYLCIGKVLNKEETINTGFFQALWDHTELAGLIDGRWPECTAIAATHPGHVHFPHTNINQDVLLYYVNMEWRPEFFGETIWYDQNQRDIIHAEAYQPNKAVWFDGNIPHTVRPGSYISPMYRFTLVFLFNQDKDRKKEL